MFLLPITFSKVQLDYFNEAWNVMDVLVIVVSLFCCGITVYTDIVVKQLLKPLLAEPTLHGDFTTLAYWTDVQNNVFAVNVFFAWLKVFKYISFNRTMQQLSTTIARLEKPVPGLLGNKMFSGALQTLSPLGSCS